MRRLTTPPPKDYCVLIVDDDDDARVMLESLLRHVGYSVVSASGGGAALAMIEDQKQLPDVVVTDLMMPGMDGLELLDRLRRIDGTLPVIMLTASGDIRSAVIAMQRGAIDYLPKPLDFELLVAILGRTIAERGMLADAALDPEGLGTTSGALKNLVGQSLSMQEVHRLAHQVASARATVLVTGESGTGKGELARALHLLGPRQAAPFVALHCAALSETLLESELFGHERGAFTGAERRRIGRFEQAQGGTLFLDEIGEVNGSIQVKLLRVLHERSFERVGGNQAVHVDVRLVAATNRDLRADVASGRFREDLYYRLNVLHIEMPTLRARGDADIQLLANKFLHRFALENERDIKGFTPAARAALSQHKWPGNVRELENAIERAVILCTGEMLDAPLLLLDAAPSTPGARPLPGSTLAELERNAIVATLQATNWSTREAARLLGVSLRTIQYRLNDYGIKVPKRGPRDGEDPSGTGVR